MAKLIDTTISGTTSGTGKATWEVGINIPFLTVEPSSPMSGDIVLADGTSWDPSGGIGLYYYNGSAWILVG